MLELFELIGELLESVGACVENGAELVNAVKKDD